MTDEGRIACSLDAGATQDRLAEIAAVGAISLIRREPAGGRHLLHFRPEPGTRGRLEAIVAAEASCCPFLDLSLEERHGELLLTVTAPAQGAELAEALAAAFGDSGPAAREHAP